MSDSESEEVEAAGRDKDWEDWEDDEDCQAPTRFIVCTVCCGSSIVFCCGRLLDDCRDILYHEKQHESVEICLKYCVTE